jgi:cellulose synthase operon protein YhjQ
VAKSVEGEGRDESVYRPKQSDSLNVNIDAAQPAIESADDLRALLSRAALKESQYREFSQPVRAAQPTLAENHEQSRASNAETSNGSSATDLEPREVVRLHLTSLDDVTETRSPNKESAPGRVLGGVFDTRTPAFVHSNGDRNVAKLRPETAENARAIRTNVDPTSEPRWSVLGRALAGDRDDSPGRLVDSLANSISIPFAFISSVSGGTGVTTILATLARCFAAEGERVLLASSDTGSLLPLYFGAPNPGAGNLQSFSIQGSDGQVDTVDRSEPKPPTPVSIKTQYEPDKRNLISTIRSAAASSERLLLDPGTLAAGGAESLHHTKAFGLVPLVPDLSCVFGLLKLEQALSPRRANAQPSNAIFYVLNKFDASLALHRDVKASLENLLGDRLLPITLRRSDAVAEALADGMTVIDYCPDAGIAQDFIQLANWLREFNPASLRERSE